MTALSAELSALVGSAFAAEGLSQSFGQVTRSDRPDLAQFQCNGALAAAKEAKTNPRAVAEKVVARLRSDPLFAKVEIAGPGFINLDLSDAALMRSACAAWYPSTKSNAIFLICGASLRCLCRKSANEISCAPAGILRQTAVHLSQKSFCRCHRPRVDHQRVSGSR